MKKLMCFVVCSVMILNFTAGLTFAGMDSIFHVYIANVEKMVGGNSRIVFTPIDLRKDNPDKGHWAYMKYLDYKEHPTSIGGGAMLRPQGAGVRKPSKKVPTEKTGLINPKNPIDIISYSDKVLFGFDMEYQGDYTAKILDSKGKVLASVSKGTSIYPNQNKGFAEVNVSTKSEKYYVELCNNDSGRREYFYILLSMRATDVKAERSAKNIQYENDRQKQYDDYMSVEQAYMKKHGITNRENLTEDDMINIAEEMRKRQFAEDNDSGTAIDELSAFPPEIRAVLEPYMKKHGIARVRDLTIKDWQALQPELDRVSGGTQTKKKRR